jgi:DNA-binding NarL/FixJ family response regulator
MPARVLLVDDATAVTELFGSVLVRELGCEVSVAARPGDVDGHLRAGPPFDLAVVDLSFPHEDANGLDALVSVHRHHAATRLVILTQGDDWVADLMRDAWEALPLAGAISKSTPTDGQVALLRQVLRDGSAPPDPVLQPWLPRERSPWRKADGFGRLVQHVGHAKLWQALIEADVEPTYRDLARATGLKLNTLKNYRAQLLGELALHGLDDPSMREMQAFAKRCRPLLAPFLTARRDGASTARS